MTQKEYEQACEIEKLKKELKNKDKKIKDLEIEKKTLKNQLKNANELIEDLQKENKTKAYNVAMRKNSLLRDEIKALKEEISCKETTIQNLSVQLKKDSTNSSKPSSTDNIYKKKVHIVSSRKAGGKNGGQWNHKGTTFSKEEVEKLIKDKKVEHKIKHIGNKKSGKYKSKYIVDVKVVTTVTEYRFYEEENGKYAIPKQMEPEVQYGSTSKALMCYLTTEMMAPLNKTRSFFKQITNNIIKLSEGTIVNTQRVLDKRLTPVVNEIKERLIKAKVMHVDETGVRINGELNWLHTCCSKDFVYYEVNEKRGKDAIDTIGILAYFVNILVHDHWKPYYKETHMTHAECNAHILRYLKGILIITEQKDVEELIKLFVEMNETKKEAILQNCTKLDEEYIEEFSNRYDKILKSWRKDLNKRMSKVKETKMFTDELNLLNRLEEYKENHLLFIKDFDVPFDNNSAERSLRMIKGKTKISGGFRTEEGAKAFAKIRSFISTCKLRTENIIEELIKIFEGNEYEFV